MNRKFVSYGAAVFALTFGGLIVTYADPIPPVEDARPSVAIPQTAGHTTQYDGGTSEQGSSVDSNTFLLQKIQALQEQLQVLQGNIEVQAHDLKMLNQQQRALYNDIDQRLVKLSHQNRVASTADTKTQAKSEQAKTEEITSASVEQPTISDRQAYQAAYELIKNKQFKLAEIALRTFLETFPNSEYSANSHYWLGELFLNQGMLDDAVKHFNIVITKYPHSNKLAAAMLKMGYTYYDKGLWKQARKELNLVHHKFPDTVSSKLALHRLREMDKHGL